jgi:hypothetical protein
MTDLFARIDAATDEQSMISCVLVLIIALVVSKWGKI